MWGVQEEEEEGFLFRIVHARSARRKKRTARSARRKKRTGRRRTGDTAETTERESDMSVEA